MDTTFADLFQRFFWLIFPIMGMGMGAFAIWTEHRRQVKGIELLRAYAEQGKDPPQAVLDALPRTTGAMSLRRTRPEYTGRAVLNFVLAVGFAGCAIGSFLLLGHTAGWVFVTGFGITSFVLVAIALQNVVLAFMSPTQNEQ